MINMASRAERHNYDIDFNPPLGLLSLATILELHGYHCSVKDYCYEDEDIGELISIINEEKIRIVTFTVYTINVDEALKYAEYIKRKIRNVTILFGGPHATLDTEYCFSSYVDYILTGEGEAAILEIVEGIMSGFETINVHQIPNLCFRRKKEKLLQNARQPITDLDLLPIVKRELFDINKYNEILNICSSRGCPAKCIYCAGSKINGKKYRIRNIENVVLEIAYIKNCIGRRIRLIYFIDDTFTVFKKRLYRYTELWNIMQIEYKWRCESRIDVMDSALIDAITNNGCIAVHFGIESGSQEVLNKIQKQINLEKAETVIEYTLQKKILVCCYFMIAHYCDTLETMRMTCNLIIHWVNKYGIDATLHYNTPYPGTYQYINREALGIQIRSSKYSDYVGYRPLIETDHFSIEDQKNIYNSVQNYLNIHNFKA